MRFNLAAFIEMGHPVLRLTRVQEDESYRFTRPIEIIFLVSKIIFLNVMMKPLDNFVSSEARAKRKHTHYPIHPVFCRWAFFFITFTKISRYLYIKYI